MKRAIPLIVILSIFSTLYQYVIVYFQNSHEITYELAKDNKSFKVQEIYKKTKNEDGYFFNIVSDDKKEFLFYVDNQYNKQKKVISQIEYYEKDDYLCIYPMDKNERYGFEILCNDGKEIYSYDYLNKKIDLKEFLVKLKLTDKYNEDITEKIVDNDVVFYKNNFYDNEYLNLYRYKYLDVFNKGELKSIHFSNNDIYKNNLGAYINNYFIVPIVDTNKTISKYFIIDCMTKESEIIYFEEPISDNLYIIGIFNDNLYIFDLDNKVEYEINTKGSFKIVGNVEQGFGIYENGEWTKKSITEFVNDRITIENKIDVDLNYDYSKIYENNNAYYIVENNKIYKIYKNKINNRILLLEIEDYIDLQIENDRIYYISNEYLYRYDKYGIKRLVNNNEFKYNNYNIYHVYNE